MQRLSASAPFVSVNRNQFEEVKFDVLLCCIFPFFIYLKSCMH